MLVTLTVLVDDIASNARLMAEHGLSLHIDTDGTRILFDTGQGHALPHNAGGLGVPLEQLDHIVLSHGHCDHSGGLAHALSTAPNALVWMHPEARRDRYSLKEPAKPRAVGMPFHAREALERHAARIRDIQGPEWLTPWIGVTGPIPRVTDFEDTGGAFFLDESGARKDDLVDDQALFVDTPSGVVVILGCAHAGVINTLRYVQTLAPTRKLLAVIGGLHLVNASPERLKATSAALREMQPDEMHPGHCTGENGVSRLRQGFLGARRPLETGAILRFSTHRKGML